MIEYTISEALWKLLKQLIPNTTKKFIGALFGGIALTALVRETYSIGFVSALASLLDYYKLVIDYLFGRFTAPLEAAVRILFHFDVALYPVWTHVCVLSGIYFLRNIHRLFSCGRWGGAIYQLVFAIPIMALAGVGAGVSYREGGALFSEMAVSVFPVASIFLMSIIQGIWFASVPRDREIRTWPDFGGSWLHFFGMQILYGLGLLAGGLALSFLFTFILMLAGLPNPAVLVLLLLVFCLALYWFFMGVEMTRPKPRTVHVEGSETLGLLLEVLDTQAAKLAIAMLQVLTLFVGIVLSGVGLALRGL